MLLQKATGLSTKPSTTSLCSSRQFTTPASTHTATALSTPAAHASFSARSRRGPSLLRQRLTMTAAAPEGKSDKPQEEAPVKYNTEFGYSRKDVTLITLGLIALGYVLYYGLQAGGMDAGMAGNYVQLAIFIGICIGWVGTYLFRVATKQMTYVKQLEAYEEAVMQKRVEEMTESELNDLVQQAEATPRRTPRQ